MQISTAFEFVRASSPTHAPRPQNISFTYNAEGHAGMALHPSHPTIRPSILSKVLTKGEQLWTAHVNCMKCRHVLLSSGGSPALVHRLHLFTLHPLHSIVTHPAPSSKCGDQ